MHQGPRTHRDRKLPELHGGLRRWPQLWPGGLTPAMLVAPRLGDASQRVYAAVTRAPSSAELAKVRAAHPELKERSFVVIAGR